MNGRLEGRSSGPMFFLVLCGKYSARTKSPLSSPIICVHLALVFDASVVESNDEKHIQTLNDANTIIQVKSSRFEESNPS